MKCAWSALINILPIWLRQYVDKFGVEHLLELRLRLGLQPELIMSHKTLSYERAVTVEDLQFSVNAASQYSPWAAQTITQGYITIEGGHRIGICGNVTYKNNSVSGMNTLTSLCIRVAREFPKISKDLYMCTGSILIIGKPGSGKTTLLRDLIREKSEQGTGAVCVVDERRELFPHYRGQFCFNTGKKTDVLSGCRKKDGIEIAIRNLGPSMIAVDEITAEEDCRALLHAGWCGVDLIATAHAGSRAELFSRVVYRPIISSNLFHTLVIMHPNKTWCIERMT